MASKCSKCGTEKVMHYLMFCPKCYIPIGSNRTVYELYKCLYHAEAVLEEPGFKDTFLKKVNEYVDLRNESTVLLARADEGDPEMEIVNRFFDACGWTDVDQVWFEVSY